MFPILSEKEASIFRTNLQKFACSTGLSIEDISETVRISNLRNRDKRSLASNELAHFAASLGLRMTSLTSDLGFEGCSYLEMFTELHPEFKKIVTRSFLQTISASEYKKVIDSALLSTSRIRSLTSGQNPITTPELNSIKHEIRDDSLFDMLLLKSIYLKIPNYNYLQFKEHFHYSYQDIGNILGLSASITSNWGGKLCSKISDKHICKIADMCGVTPWKFVSQVINVNSITAAKIDKVEPTESDSAQSNKTSKETSVSAKQRTECLTDEQKLLKMYSHLSSEDKMTARQFIEDLFFKSL